MANDDIARALMGQSLGPRGAQTAQPGGGWGGWARGLGETAKDLGEMLMMPEEDRATLARIQTQDPRDPKVFGGQQNMADLARILGPEMLGAGVIKKVGGAVTRGIGKTVDKALNESEILQVIEDFGTNLLETNINKTGISAVKTINRFGNPKKVRKTFKAGTTEKEIKDWLGVTEAVGKLPIDEISRMARAKEMFPHEAYHGTAKDFPEFGGPGTVSSTGAKSAQKAYWFSDSPKTASGYAGLAGENEVQNLINASRQAEIAKNWDEANRLMVEAEKLDAIVGRGENVIPTRLRGNLKEVDMEGIKYDPDDVNLSEILDDAALEGYDGVKLTNFSDEAGYGVYNPTTHYAIFDPQNIRSRFAAFDPTKKTSANLLAGVAGAAALPGLAEALMEEQQ